MRLPPYRYVPGLLPHPLRHPNGYLRGDETAAPPPSADAAMRIGIDLFNRAYYWQAHEVWEGRWHEASGDERTLLQTLIQLAAGYLKLAQHAPSDLAAQLFERARAHATRLGARLDPSLGTKRSAIERAIELAIRDATRSAPFPRPRLTYDRPVARRQTRRTSK